MRRERGVTLLLSCFEFVVEFAAWSSHSLHHWRVLV